MILKIIFRLFIKLVFLLVQFSKMHRTERVNVVFIYFNISKLYLFWQTLLKTVISKELLYSICGKSFDTWLVLGDLHYIYVGSFDKLMQYFNILTPLVYFISGVSSTLWNFSR